MIVLTFTELATQGPLKATVFRKEGYHVMTFPNDVPEKYTKWLRLYWRYDDETKERSYIKFIKIWIKKRFFEGWSCFKFISLGLELGMALNCNSSVARG